MKNFFDIFRKIVNKEIEEVNSSQTVQPSIKSTIHEKPKFTPTKAQLEAATALVTAMREKVTPELKWKEFKETVYHEVSISSIYGQGWSVRLGLQQCWYQEKEVKDERLTVGIYNDDFPYKSEHIVALGNRGDIIEELADDHLIGRIAEGIQEGYGHLDDVMREIRRG